MADQDTQSYHTDDSASEFSDQETEARAFGELEATQKGWAKEHEKAVVVFQFPDNRTLFQRMAAWWFLPNRREQSKTQGQCARTKSQ